MLAGPSGNATLDCGSPSSLVFTGKRLQYPPAGNRLSRLVPAVVERHSWALAIVGAGWLYFAGPLLWSPGDLYLIDTSLIDLPFRFHAAQLLRAGHFPFWTSQLECGFALFSDGQAGVLYPPFWLYVVWPKPQAHDVFMAAHYLLAGLTMYWFLQRRGLQSLAAALGAVAYFGGPILLASHVVPGIPTVFAWLPLALICIDLYSEGRPAAIWWCAVVNALILLAGIPNAALMVLLVEAAYLLLRQLPAVKSLVRSAGIIFGVSAAMAAIQLWPTLDYYRQSHRSGGLSWDAITANCVSSCQEVFTMGVSRAVDIPVAWTSFVAVSLLGVIALVGHRPRTEALFWGGMAAAGLVLSLDTPLLRVWYLLPVVSWFRWPMLYTLILHTSLCVLMAQGASIVVSRLSSTYPSRLATAVSACGVLALAIAADWRTMAGCLSPPGFYELAAKPIVESAHGASYFRLLPLLHGTVEGRESQFEQRFWSTKRLRESALVLAPNYALLHDVPVAVLKNQIDAVTPRNMTELLTAVPVISPRFLQVAAITHLSDIEPIRGELARSLELVSSDPVFFYRVREPTPRAWLVTDVESLTHPVQISRQLMLGDFDLRQRAVVESTEVPLPPATVKGSNVVSESGEVQWKEPSPGQLVFEVDAPQEAFLVVAERYAPEFEARVDNRPTTLWRTNYAFQGVRVGPGKHRVELQYVPTAFYRGAAVSVAFTLLTLVALVRIRARGVTQTTDQKPARRGG